MTVIIRRMQAGDIPAVAAIEKDNFSEPWSDNGFFTALEREDTVFLVAEDSVGRIAGYCGFYYSYTDGEITNVVVDKEYRRQGIGRRLLEEIDIICKDKGLESLTLEVRFNNEAAVELYKKMGYEEAGIRKNFYVRPTEDARVMIKNY